MVMPKGFSRIAVQAEDALSKGVLGLCIDSSTDGSESGVPLAQMAMPQYRGAFRRPAIR
jgi:hypothetical protein